MTVIEIRCLRRRLGILHEDVEIAVLVKYAGIEQFVFHVVARAARFVAPDLVGKRGLRILVQIFHVGVRRRAVEIKIVLFDILAMIAFAVGQAEESFLENRIFAVPERSAKHRTLMVVGRCRQSVLTPAIGAGPGLVVGEVIPGVAVWL